MARQKNTVSVRREAVAIPTYEPAAPERHPMFLERRVYQGSSGRVYPLPIYDRIANQPVSRQWDAVHLENEYLYVMIMPELGGRVHVLRDKTNGYDAVYRQSAIKPALVGLAGPWISGGIEFNWPQHHRPATFMPVSIAIEHEPDGAITVWCSDHDPIARMKGMHGVCLRPGRSCLELKVRVYNRTADTQTFLWWANVATRVHERYESFFPPDARFVADHAKRAMSSFPLCAGRYYGVDYGRRARRGISRDELPSRYRPASDLSPNSLAWYANIPVPTSYMCMGSQGDFFGGYDHRAGAGLMHVANHHISPGKKQWTWGNHEFGYAWDRKLTDADAAGEFPPYIELMAGVYTDNQPDFSHLQPGETKTWQQYWYPIRGIGPARKANRDAAVSLAVRTGRARIGVAITQPHMKANVRLLAGEKVVKRWTEHIGPDRPFIQEVNVPRKTRMSDLTVIVNGEDERELLRHCEQPERLAAVPKPATEAPPATEISSNDELFVTGLHLEQYRHATRDPDAYWQEALRRDPGDSRCHLALGRWYLRRGEFRDAQRHLRASIARLTLRNPNPADGEPLYQLGVCLRHLERDDEAYDVFYKATWNQAWAGAAYHALAEIDASRQDWLSAQEHLERALRLNMDNLRARCLLAIALKRAGDAAACSTALNLNRSLDPLDPWTQRLMGRTFPGDTQTRLDGVHDCAKAGLDQEAIQLIESAAPERWSGTEPIRLYTLAWLHDRRGDHQAALRCRRAAREAPPDYCFPARLEEIAILKAAIAADPKDARAPYYLGNLLYDRRRCREAIKYWRNAAQLDPHFSIVWRNLGIGHFNILGDRVRARSAYDRAVKTAPDDARLRYERDQLWKRLGVSADARLRALEGRRDLLSLRDDLTVEYCALLNHAGRHEDARDLLGSRRFQPWEGGEGQVLGQHVRTQLLLGRSALERGEATNALEYFKAALAVPENLGEGRHLLANQSDIYLALGDAYSALNQRALARSHWRRAVSFRGDFQEMSVRSFSEMTYFSAVAWERLGNRKRARELLESLLAFARSLRNKPALIDYFATSLPTMLLFTDDLAARQMTTALFLEAQARHGLGQRKQARRLLEAVIEREPSHAMANDLKAVIARSNDAVRQPGSRLTKRVPAKAHRGSS